MIYIQLLLPGFWMMQLCLFVMFSLIHVMIFVLIVKMPGCWTSCCCLTLKVEMTYINDLHKQTATWKIIRINSISPIALPNLILLNYIGNDLNHFFFQSEPGIFNKQTWGYIPLYLHWFLVFKLDDISVFWGGLGGNLPVDLFLSY